MPSFSEDMTFETISPGVINITWSTNTDYYTSFILYLNEDNFLNTTDKCEFEFKPVFWKKVTPVDIL